MHSPSLSDLADHLLRCGPHHNQLGDWTEGSTQVFRQHDTLVVLNKSDLFPHEVSPVLTAAMLRERWGGLEACSMSCKTGDGVDSFMACMQRILQKM